MSSTCDVVGCNSPREQVLELSQLPGKGGPGVPVLQWAVCRPHHAALVGGEPFALGDDGHGIVIGEGAVPPRLLNVRVHENGISNTTVIFEVGHKGVKTQSWELQVSAEMASQLLDELIGGGGMFGDEIKRNKVDPV